MADITFEQVTKVYGDGTKAVSSVDLEIEDGKILVLVGPSGCGKTTLLRMVAGLEDITDGTIRIGGEVVNDVPPKHRDIAMIFQNYALYPHMSTYDNMAFALKLRHVSRAEIQHRVTQTAKTLGLSDQLRKKPRNLSGGQRQRVAMGRAIVRDPQAFLMDEPLSNLDAKLRVQMRSEIGRLQRDLGVTTIYVTHDQTEALTLGDSVAVMRGGALQQVGPPQTLFERPANLFVAGFIGSPSMNFAQGTVEAENGVLHARVGSERLRVPESVAAAHPGLAPLQGKPVVVGIRPESIEDASLARETPVDARLHVTTELRETLGHEAFLHFSVDAPPVLTDEVRELAADTDTAVLSDLEREATEHRSRFVARVNSRTAAREGDDIELIVDTSALHFFDLETGNAL
jgi:multiple sugar transport system ATP-binding protein